MPKRETIKPKRVTKVAPVTGNQYQAIQSKLNLDVSRYLHRLGGTMRDHYLALHHPQEPMMDITLSLHLRLLDQYPELVEREPTVDELLIKCRQIARENPSLKFPMRLTGTFIALLLGRNPRSSSMWNVGKSLPAGKVSKLIKELLLILDSHPDPAAFLQEYMDLVLIEAGTRGEHQLFTAKKWPNPTRRGYQRKGTGPSDDEGDDEGEGEHDDSDDSEGTGREHP